MFDTDPAIQDIVDNFDAHGLTLKTEKSEEELERGIQPAQNHNMMAKAAKHATTLGK